jgi:hypothetical protein
MTHARSNVPLPSRSGPGRAFTGLLPLTLGLAAFGVLTAAPPPGKQPDPPKSEPLPFNHKVETYRSKEGVMVFSLRLEQPFLAEEFDKSNFLRVQAQDRNAYLIYPPQTKFQQKHAEFYGRLRGEGKARLRITYEMVSENLDGSRKIDTRHGDVEIPIPTAEGGPEAIYREWAQQQNTHFLALLSYYPGDTFYQYALLQSRERHGVPPPALPRPVLSQQDMEYGLYHVFTGSQGIQEALQRYTLTQGARPGDLNVHISQLQPPALQSPPYEALLNRKKEKGVQPKVHEITRLVPEDQYCVQFNSFEAAGNFLDLAMDWGDSLLRLFRVHARDNRLQEKYEDQLCLRREPLAKLFAEGAVSELAVTGADPFVIEGTDYTVLFRLQKPDVFEKGAADWLEEVKKKYPGVEEREFNYRGHRIRARYREDRVVSSFVVRLGDYAVYSNSHRAVRKVVDAFAGAAPRLFDALDYRYVTTLLPPSPDRRSGYLYASEAFLRHLVGPAEKISEKRRVQCFNNLIMLNNASLLYRMENAASPGSLSDLTAGRYVDAGKLICPGGGAYSWDNRGDSCNCSLHNRLKYLTPNLEISTLKVSAQEQQEYDRYKQRYQAFYAGLFDPIAVRITTGPRLKLETCILPLANGGLYAQLRESVAKKPLPLGTTPFARSAVLSLLGVSGRQANAASSSRSPGSRKCWRPTRP